MTTSQPSRTDARSSVETVFRMESPRIIAGVTRVVRDVGIAEELAQDALVAALEQWPRDGVPDNPGAWLMAIARRKAVDLVRRRENYARKLAEIGRDLSETAPPEEPSDPEDIDDDLLRLVFTTCHPVLSAQARTALTLRLLGGLSTPEIARAFLVPEATVAQRIVRAKRTLATRNIAFEVPYGPDREARLGSVLDVIYLIFNEGYAATAGDDWLRPSLCEDALRLARVLSALMPKEPEVHGLTSLLEFQASRTAARTGPRGEPVLLKDQNRSRWNRMLIARGIKALARAETTARSAPPAPTSSRPASPPVTRTRTPTRRPTGRPSPPCTPCSQPVPPPRWSNSTARSRSRWPRAPARPWRSSTRSPANPPCSTTTCCRACAAICWPASDVRPRRGPSSSGRPR
ncbi:RNA polymerase sigma factor (sigma-70 family) [Streptomyces sp. SAI-135]|nr:RNA polymerase sigma factor (sigma-70 family) [Streptomyces sp. SAI-135]